jgi:hypothetical protein
VRWTESSFGMRGTDTGGNAATCCGGAAGLVVSFGASGCAFAMPFKNTSSTIWSKYTGICLWLTVSAISLTSRRVCWAT